MEKRDAKWLENYINSLVPKNLTVRILDYSFFAWNKWADFEISIWDKKKNISTPAIPLWIERGNLKKPFIKKLIKKTLIYLKGVTVK